VELVKLLVIRVELCDPVRPPKLTKVVFERRKLHIKGAMKDRDYMLLTVLIMVIVWGFSPFVLGLKAFPLERYIPSAPSIGVDLSQVLGYSEAWIKEGSPYVGSNLYPPLAAILFVPLTVVGFSSAYIVWVLITVCCFAGFAYAVAKKTNDTVLTLLLFIPGMFSYGFLFELNRGQFNIVAMMLCLAAVAIFHRKPNLRPIAYILFILSVQMKVYPMVFVLLLRDGNSKRDIVRMLVLGLTSAGLFFSMGTHVFGQFMDAIIRNAARDDVWWANSSATAFSFYSHYVLGFSIDGKILLGLVTVAIGLIFYQTRRNPLDPRMMFACAAGALLIPAVSLDYKLPLVILPAAFVIAEKKSLVWIAAFGALLYATMLSFAVKPWFLANNFPLVATMLLMNIEYRWNRKPIISRTEERG
jgi:hypothetical protein